MNSFLAVYSRRHVLKLVQYSGTQVDGPVGYVFQNPDHQIVMPTVAADVAFGLGRWGNTVDQRASDCCGLHLMSMCLCKLETCCLGWACPIISPISPVAYLDRYPLSEDAVAAQVWTSA